MHGNLMLPIGMIFFVLAVVSGLCGFADVIAPRAAQAAFYVCVSLASLSFVLRLRGLSAAATDPVVSPPEANS